MFVVIIIALLMLFSGATFLSGWLSQSPWLFMGYWFVCAWLTLLAILLAAFDLLMVRIEARVAKRKLHVEIFGKDGDKTESRD